ncbi:hypothetical protein BpHYR1_049350 [Brachionus plicatilis]|uniref:Uncharacterized protein n=1 Tax=Brachionus plicatilis TaxID=10195 RepID=A0A3M7RIT0_BRAPC|nr:hypothetical protein BpHYR1_049350 [Brachionus plicatilis]
MKKNKKKSMYLNSIAGILSSQLIVESSINLTNDKKSFLQINIPLYKENENPGLVNLACANH